MDADTPVGQRSKQMGDANYTLVFSDEFEGDAPESGGGFPTTVSWDAAYVQPGVKWTASNVLSMDAFGDSFMSPTMIRKANGSVIIRAQKQRYQGAEYLGGQLTTWNRMCFQGGYLEVRYKNPGSWGLDGLWAAIWTMGVLVRDNFMVRNLNIWPYSYSDCGCPGSLFHGAAPLPEISGCYPSPGFGLNAFQGRGAAEFDLTETNECTHFDTSESRARGIAPDGQSCMLQTIQIGPRLPWEWRPLPFSMPSEARQWYGYPWEMSAVLHYYNPTFLNSAFYGFGWYDSISATTLLSETNFSEWHTVAMHVVIDDHCEMYQFPRVPLNESMAERCRQGSAVSFYLDGRVTTSLDGTALAAVGTTAARLIPQEPLYVLLEQKISPKFGFGTPPESALPTDMHFDYVRLYQLVDRTHVPRLACSPPDHPSAEYFRANAEEYGVSESRFAFDVVDVVATHQDHAKSLTIIAATAPLLDVISLFVIIIAVPMAFFGSLDFGGSARTMQAFAIVTIFCTLPSLVVLAALNQPLAVYDPVYPSDSSSFGYSTTLNYYFLIGAFLCICTPLGLCFLGFARLFGPTVTYCSWMFASSVVVLALFAQAYPSDQLGFGSSPLMPIWLLVSLFSSLSITAVTCYCWCQPAPRKASLQHVLNAYSTAISGGAMLSFGVAWQSGWTCSWFSLLALGMSLEACADFSRASSMTVFEHGASIFSPPDWLLICIVLIACMGGFAMQMFVHFREGRVSRPVGRQWLLGGFHTPASIGSEGETAAATTAAPIATATADRAADTVALPSPPQAAPPPMAQAQSMLHAPPIEWAALPWPEPLGGAVMAGWEGCTRPDRLQPVIDTLRLCFGFQSSSLASQRAHLLRLVQQKHSRPGVSEEAAAKAVHRDLLSNYRRWCRAIGQPPRSAGTLVDALLYLAIWSEAANLRHTPELLCWLFHQAAAKHAAFGTGRPTRVCNDFLDVVVTPLYKEVSQRMKRDKLTYDDVNEAFWQAHPWLLATSPFEEAGLAAALSALATCSKTHMEIHSWFHLLACFADVFFLIFSLVYFLMMLAFCYLDGAVWLQYLARLSSTIYLYDVYLLFSVQINLWAEGELEPTLQRGRTNMYHPGTIAYRIVLFVLVQLNGLILFGAFTTEVCALTEEATQTPYCGLKDPTIEMMNYTDPARASAQFALNPCVWLHQGICVQIHPRDYTPNGEQYGFQMSWWIVFWSLSVARHAVSFLVLLCQEGHCQDNGITSSWLNIETFGSGEVGSDLWMRRPHKYKVFGRGGAFARANLVRFLRETTTAHLLGPAHRRAWLASLFWLLLLILYSLFIYTQSAYPGMVAYCFFRTGFESGYLGLGQLITLIGTWLTQTVTISIIVLDCFFQLAVLFVALGHFALRPRRVPCALCYTQEDGPLEGDALESFRAKLFSHPSWSGAWDAAADATPSAPAASLPAQAAEEGSEDPAPRDPRVTRLWEAIVLNLRECDLISNDEANGMSYERLSEAVAATRIDIVRRATTTFINHEQAMKEERQRGGWLPANSEAVRRLRGFFASLKCEMPAAPPVASMGSVSIMVPMYSETVLYSSDELRAHGSDGRPLLHVLATLYADEWTHFCERQRLDPEKVLAAHTEPPEAPSAWFESGLRPPNADEVLAVRWWASVRGQTLARTVAGFATYADALRLQAQLEDGVMSHSAARQLVDEKFEIVVGAQLYGDWRAAPEQRARREDVDELLRRFPDLRVCFPEKVERTSASGNGRETSGGERTATTALAGVDAVLVSADEHSGEIRELHRIKLPGNPILGEGKPENQNVIIQFTRGRHLMVVDMNQDGYFEEALKLRNLLEEFEPSGLASEGTDDEESDDALDATGHPQPRRITLIGFPENVFSQSNGFATSIYAAMQERYFGSFFQRVLASPLDVRMHYGHPDLADKLHFMTRGGVSKASKSINLSEDVFAGYKTTLRGGRSAFKEYHQCGKGRGATLAEISGFFAKLSQGAAFQLQSRDVYRLCRLLPLERKLSVFFSVFGFYVANAITMYTVQITAFIYAVLAVGGLLTTYAGMATSLMVLSTYMPIISMLIMLLPDVFMVCSEQGWGGGFKFFAGKLVTLSPLYYIFISQTRAYNTANTLRWGKGGYFKTNRSLAVTHRPLHELFQAYSRSHYNPALDTALMLVIAMHINVPKDFPARIWALWLVISGILVTPFLYNPLALDVRTLWDDLGLWSAWCSKRGLEESGAAKGGGKGSRGKEDSGKVDSWLAWWERIEPKPDEYDDAALLGCFICSLIYGYLASALLPQILYTVGPREMHMVDDAGMPVSAAWWAAFRQAVWWNISLGIAAVLPPLCLATFDTLVDAHDLAERYAARSPSPLATHFGRLVHVSLVHLRTILILSMVLCSVVWYVCVVLLVGKHILGPQCPYFSGNAAWRLWFSLPVAAWATIFVWLCLSCSAYGIAVLQRYMRPARHVLCLLQRTRDYCEHALLHFPLLLLALLWVPKLIQERILFQPTETFFTRGPTGTWTACAYVTMGLLLLVGLIAYLALQLLGIMPVAWLDPFLCS